MTEYPVVYADDPDAAVTWPVTDRNGNDLTFTPLCAVGAGEFDIAATWQGAAVVGADSAVTRDLRVPLTGVTPGGLRTVYLQVPGDNDIALGRVHVRART